jgi:hypothetical protein
MTALELEDEPVMAGLGFNRYAWDAPKREPRPVESFFGGAYAALYMACALRRQQRPWQGFPPAAWSHRPATMRTQRRA